MERTGAVAENPHKWTSKYGSLIITGWDGPAILAGFLVAFAIAVLGIIGSAAALRGRLQRT
jgi:hypothetical protein